MIDGQIVRRQNLGYAFLSLSAFALSERSIVILVVGTSLSIASWFITAGWRKRMLPEWAVLSLILISFAVVILRVYSDPYQFEIPSVIGILVSVGIVLRMYARRTSSDERQILMMSSILLFIAALQSSDLIVGVLVLCATLMAVHCVVRFRFAVCKERQERTGIDGGIFLRESTTERRRSSRDLKWVIRFALLIIMILTVSIFVLLPRNPEPISSLFGMSGYSQLDFPTGISLMSPVRLNPAKTELLSIEWLGSDGKHPVNIDTMRLRGAVLDVYDSRPAQWSSRRTMAREVVTLDDDTFKSLGKDPIDERINTFTMRVEFRGLHSGVLFSPWTPISIRTDKPRVFLIAPRTLSIRLLGMESLGGINGYEMQIQPYPSEATLTSLQGNPTLLPPLPTFPVLAVEDAANKILSNEEIDSTLARVDASARWARNARLAKIFESELTSERFRYTLDLRSFVRSGDRDPVDLFLNEYRFGHCEYFASGLCALCQSVGVDARIVIGYLAKEFDKSSQRFIVRESDGHAWVEVRTGLHQWTVFDPTPVEEDNPNTPGDDSWAIFRFFFAPVESLWREQIAQFDARAQNALVQQSNEWFRAMVKSSWDSIERTARNASNSSQLLSSSYIWFGSVALAITLSCAAAFFAYRKWQRMQRALGVTRRSRIQTKIAMRDGAFYVDALDLLERRGIRRPPNLLLTSFVERVQIQHSIAGEIFSEIVKRFYAIRFGGERPDPRRRASDNALVAQMRQAFSQHLRLRNDQSYGK
ncbi:MAG: DUF3488 and transglutaminase-like domain-containing protein [Planctomycetota bacterium]|nr:DUF3488 and transglutaminase-like domain-containing protein [Planctomycetota bacterium]MDA1262476.1 DUF3488 and transglutaminase-like domain-containing protein [Planctomycetota bacterium]